MNLIQSAFDNLWAHVTGLSKSAWAYFENYVLPVLKTDAGQLLIQLAPIALSVVTQVEQNGGLPNDKRDAALAQLKSAAVSAGINAATSVLNTAIENAVQQLKASQPTATNSVASAPVAGTPAA